MKEKYKISVIVPIYKVETYLRCCIESICRQTYRELEILLIDDGSPDECGKICEEYAKRDSRIKVIHIENGGQSHARNVGLEVATGDYIGFVDGDDHINISMYERLLETAITNEAQIVECNFHGRKVKVPDEMEEGAIFSMSGKESITRQLDTNFQSRFPSTSVWSKLFKRECIQGVRFPDGRIHEEYAFLCEAFLNTDRYVYINECLYDRTLRSDSTTAEKFSARTLDKIYVFQQRNELLKKRNEEELYQYSKAREYELLIHYAAMARQEGLVEEEKLIEGMISTEKKNILLSRLSLSKKMQFCLFFINKQLYYKIRG